MTPQEARIEIKRLKEYAVRLTDQYIEEMRDTQMEIKRLRRVTREKDQ